MQMLKYVKYLKFYLNLKGGLPPEQQRGWSFARLRKDMNHVVCSSPLPPDLYPHHLLHNPIVVHQQGYCLLSISHLPAAIAHQGCPYLKHCSKILYTELLCNNWRKAMIIHNSFNFGNITLFTTKHLPNKPAALNRSLVPLSQSSPFPECLTWIQHPRILNVCSYTVPVKSLDTPTHSRVFLYFYYFLHCTIIVKTSKLWNNTYGIMYILQS